MVPDLSAASTSKTANKEEKAQNKSDVAASNVEPPDNALNTHDSFSKKSVRFAESKTFDAMMRSDINLEESDDRSNFQSVMITPNNSLRQKHQNIVASSVKNQNLQGGLLQLLHKSATNQSADR